jgi:hypothetical protein
MLTIEWTFIKVRAAEFELHKLCATCYLLWAWKAPATSRGRPLVRFSQ